jgi:hypothetical protein
MSNPPSNALPLTHARTQNYLAGEQSEKLLRLGDHITELAAHLDAGTFQLLKLIGEFDENGGWHGPGIQSCAHWLNWKCGISMGPAREKVRVARALPGLPRMKKPCCR